MTTETHIDIAQLFPHGQIRLAELSVYNWGSFHGLHTAAIDPHGTLITGDNGAGKSTLIDGLIALLQSSGKAIFNVAAAQGDRTDRSMVSYIRGSYGNERDGLRTRVQSKREGAVVSGLRAKYAAEDGTEFALASLLWIPNASSALADLKRLFFAARRDLTLEELLETFDRGQARAVKHRYRGDDRVLSSETFSEYQEAYRRILHLHNENAPALLARALGLKKIDDLTALIRDFVLEPSTVREAARKAVAEFADLVATHDELLDARRQQQMLSTLPVLQKELQRAQREQNELEAEKAALPVYFAERGQALWRERVRRAERELEEIDLGIEKLNRARSDGNEQMEARHAEYLQAGGSRIDDLQKDLKRAEDQLEQTTEAASGYQQVALALGLDERLLESSYRTNLELANTSAREFGEQKKTAQDRFGTAAASFSDAQQRLVAMRSELHEVEKRPDSAIDPAFQRLRDEMAEALGFAAGKLMFLGELIDVKDAERGWQGAIERALGGLRLTLAVQEDRYRLVTGWLNQRHVGMNVRAQVVRETKLSPRFKEDGFLRKLEWRPHPYRDWLKQHLARFDLACVPDSETLNVTPFSVTQAGLIHRESGRFEKRDLRRIDDRSEWRLGFSNARRLALLQGQIREQQVLVEGAQLDASKARIALDSVDEQHRLWKDLQSVRWERIDLPRARHLVKDTKHSLQLLEEASGGLGQAKKRWEAAKARITKIQDRIDQDRDARGKTSKDLERSQAAEKQAELVARPGMTDEVRERLERRVGALQDDQLEQFITLESGYRVKVDSELDKAASRYASAGRKAVGVMSAYRAREEWQSITAEWGSELLDLPTYIERLEHIERDGLPKLVEDFRERLNRHTTHSLAGIRSQINNELDDIRERIETINSVLARTEFRHGTHLNLKAELDEYEHVRDFNRRLQGVMQAAMSDDHEARFAGLQAVVSILEKATSAASGYTKESQRLLDPRYRLSFVAEDIETATGKVLDVLASSSGKSGGEKEAFAGTVVAASLAYVLTPDGADRPTYCTVFLDEAFSNTAEAVSRRVLRIFRELHIHVNLITPFKNLNLARESARSLLIAERDQQRHESRLCQVTWEEIDRKLAERAARRLPGMITGPADEDLEVEAQ
jgi:uncharacterized protein YPO0396